MRPLRFLRGLLTRSLFATLLELVAFGIAVVVIFHFLGLWWALVAVAVVLILIALALDRSDV